MLDALERIYHGKINPSNEIDKELFQAVRAVFDRATDAGFAGKLTHREADFLESIRYNNAVFSAFKVHRLQNDVAAQLLDQDGVLKSFQQWRMDVQGIVSHHTDTWLQTEYDTAVKRADMAATLMQFEREKDVLPNLRWMPSLSITPRESHRVFWGLVRPINDPFWSQHRPGDEWGCKCGLEATDDPATETIPDGGAEVRQAPGLAGNPAQTGKIFSDDHPYIANAYPGAKKAVQSLLKELGIELEKVRKFKGGGELRIHSGVDKKKSDYQTVLTVGRRFAEAGHNVRLTPVVHFKSEEYKTIYGSLFGTKYARKCPDLLIDGRFYEFEGFVAPFSKHKTSRMLNHGLKQSSRIVIDNNKGASDRFIKRLINSRIIAGSSIDEVWLYEKGKVRLFYKRNEG